MSPLSQPILPGATLGILGSGQLGRMLAMAARRLGYRVHVFSPEHDTPAGAVADVEISASYTDLEALKRFGESVDVVTIEFENIPVSALETLSAVVPVYPQPSVLHITQHRLREKTFLTEHAIPVTPFYAVHNASALEAGIASLGLPLVLKTAGFGYDGKGQARVHSLEEAQQAYVSLGETDCILERFVDLAQEISVIAARTPSEFAAYRPVENRHEKHILDVTLAPASISTELENEALAVTKRILEALDMQGLLCVEFFVTRTGELLVNELAPRPHNSGHYTIEAAYTSQFEQQLRAVCGLPLGDPGLRQPAAMANLLGDLWEGDEPDWGACLKEPQTYLHLYGKASARPGRKMGHITALGDTTDQALSRALATRNALI